MRLGTLVGRLCGRIWVPPGRAIFCFPHLQAAKWHSPVHFGMFPETETIESKLKVDKMTLFDLFQRIRVVSVLGRFGLSRFGLGRFGQFWGWVVSALVGGSFRPIFWVSRFGPESFRPKFMEVFW